MLYVKGWPNVGIQLYTIDHGMVRYGMVQFAPKPLRWKWKYATRKITHPTVEERRVILMHTVSPFSKLQLLTWTAVQCCCYFFNLQYLLRSERELLTYCLSREIWSNSRGGFTQLKAGNCWRLINWNGIKISFDFHHSITIYSFSKIGGYQKIWLSLHYLLDSQVKSQNMQLAQYILIKGSILLDVITDILNSFNLQSLKIDMLVGIC